MKQHEFKFEYFSPFLKHSIPKTEITEIINKKCIYNYRHLPFAGMVLIFFILSQFVILTVLSLAPVSQLNINNKGIKYLCESVR